MDNLKIALDSVTKQSITLLPQDGAMQTISLVTPVGGTSNYERLKNKPSINGVVLQGDKTSVDLNIVSENTESGWGETPLFVPKRGEICVYSDTKRIKIGDGSVPIVDLPYINGNDFEMVWSSLQRHVEDTSIHVTQQEKDFWNAKLNYDVSGEKLTFTRN